MFSEPQFLFNAALCFGAFVLSHRVHPGRNEARLLAALLCVNFVFCAMCWTPYSPKYWLNAIGANVSNKELWMLADALFGAACMIVAYRRWWGWALGGTAFFQVFVHLAREDKLIEAAAYSEILTIVLYAQLTLFYTIGGRGIGDFLFSSIDRLRHRGGSGAQASHSSANEAAE